MTDGFKKDGSCADEWIFINCKCHFCHMPRKMYAEVQRVNILNYGKKKQTSWNEHLLEMLKKIEP